MALTELRENTWINKDQICYVQKSEQTDVTGNKISTYLVSFTNGLNMELTEAEFNTIK